MLSLAMIRVEPGSTPGIGITIAEHFFLGFFVFCGRSVLLFARGIGRMQQRCWKKFRYCYYIPTDTWFWGLHTTSSSPPKSMKNMDTLEEPHLSALLATATYLLQSE